ncbi:MAG: hypothetical protein GF344_15340 [Chitinivibrionales bacterium]|nr:hypothetical protein [Chitinivibrionales bacterium]MBD3358080.1 hypothetical protein [Chitinivibrionales bacterium]
MARDYAGRLPAQGDTMGMLSAVLDNTFRLTTHLITISLNYAGCLGVGIAAHVYIANRAFGSNKPMLANFDG